MATTTSGRSIVRPTTGSRTEAAPSKWAIFGLVSVGTFMTTLDASIVNIALPSIARWFDTPASGLVEWVVIAYLMAIAATLLTFGRLADLVGREKIWVAGLALFSAGSVPVSCASASRSVASSSSRRSAGRAICAWRWSAGSQASCSRTRQPGSWRTRSDGPWRACEPWTQRSPSRR